jgi:hypothetical protein
VRDRVVGLLRALAEKWILDIMNEFEFVRDRGMGFNTSLQFSCYLFFNGIIGSLYLPRAVSQASCIMD